MRTVGEPPLPTTEPAVKALLQPENRLFLLTVLVAALSAVVTAWPEALQP